MGLAPLSHEALLAAVRSGDAAAVRALLADAEVSGASLATLAGEAAVYVAAEAEREEVVCLLLSIYDFKANAICSGDHDTFHLAALPGYIGRAPYFDVTEYGSWKYKMKIHLMAIHPSVWWIVEKGFTVKDMRNPTTKELQNLHKNAQAANLILSALPPNEYNKVFGLESAKEIWDTLQLAHEGTSIVRELKIELLMGELERFVMKDGETPKEMYNRLILIVNEIKGLGSKEMTDNFVVKRMLRAFTPRNPILVTIIRELEDFAKLKPHDVLGRIVTHELMEQESKKIHDLINQSSSSKKKDLGLKARKEAEESSSEEQSDDEQEEDEIALFSKRLKKILKRKGKSKETHSKRPCYECGETSHFMVSCPNKDNYESSSSKKKDLGLKARKEAEESSSEEEESDDEQEEDEIARFSKRLKKILKRKERHSKRPCYECGETGHFMADCPNKDNDEKKE